MNRPRPLRTDGSNAFARYSMQERVPRIARDVLDRNPDYPAVIAGAVERLARDIEGDAPLPPPQMPAPDGPDWAQAHATHPAERWLDAEWFFAELAFYREIVRACRFWETGRDPFGPAKDEELAGPRPWSRLEDALGACLDPPAPRADRIAALLEACLWGNRVDLSYTIAAARTHHHADDLLVDERAAALPLLLRPGAQIHLLADNAGTELALDLALVDAILADDASAVTLHLKIQPTFVSDAMPRDVLSLLARMGDRGGLLGAMADRLEAAFAAGRLSLLPDPFWTGPRFLWEAPAHLRAQLHAATLLVVKGDANYRRLIGDALWPPATPLAQACAYLRTPAVCLRTMKSDAVVGLPAGLAEDLDARAPRWRVDGQRGLLQTHLPPAARGPVSPSG